MERTGYSAPSFQGTSLNTSGTSSYSANAVEPQAKKSAPTPAPAAPALAASLANIPERDIHVVRSVASSVERGRRLAFAKARRERTRKEMELANADVYVAEGELEEALAGSVAGSVGRVADLDSEGGNSARVRPRSSAERAVHYYSWKECNKVLHACLLKKRRRAQAYLRKREATPKDRASC